jgi:hypothetical protein
MGGIWKPELTKYPEPVKKYWREQKRRQKLEKTQKVEKTDDSA